MVCHTERRRSHRSFHRQHVFQTIHLPVVYFSACLSVPGGHRRPWAGPTTMALIRKHALFWSMIESTLLMSPFVKGS